MKVVPEFVECIPEVLEDGKLYISRTYATAVHKCCCGCGNKVVTPLSSASWQLKVSGQYVSLYPSIGNWSFPCRSHYWIRRNQVIWSYSMTQAEIDAGRRYGAKMKERYFETGALPEDIVEIFSLAEPEEVEESKAADTFWGRLKRWIWGV